MGQCLGRNTQGSFTEMSTSISSRPEEYFDIDIQHSRPAKPDSRRVHAKSDIYEVIECLPPGEATTTFTENIQKSEAVEEEQKANDSLSFLTAKLREIKSIVDHVPEVHGMYACHKNRKIIIDIDIGSTEKVKDHLLSNQPRISTLVDLHEQENDVCFLICIGGKIVTKERADSEIIGTSTDDFHDYKGSVACLGLTGSHKIVMLTAKHLFSTEHRLQHDKQFVLSDINGEFRLVSESYYGDLSAVDFDGQLRGVDIALLPLIPKISDKLLNGMLRTINDVFIGKDGELMHKKVWKNGAKTSFSCGIIVETNYYLRDANCKKVLTGCHLVIKPESEVFAEKGDSGSLIWSYSNIPIGIVSRKKTVTINGDTFVGTLCCRLDHCLKALNSEWPDETTLLQLKAYR